MSEDMIERYATFNTKGCPDDQPITPDYYDFLNDDDGNGKNIPGTPVDSVLLEKKVFEYSVVQNNEYIDEELIIDDADSLISSIDPLQN